MRRILLCSVVAALALVAPAGAEAPAPQIVDGANDANLINNQGVALLGNVGPVDSGEASYDPADLRTVRFETLFEAVPVGADGIDYRATGLAIHVATTATPKSDGPTLGYRINASVGGCGGFLQAFLRGPSSTPSDPANKAIQWRTFASRGCADGDKTVTNPAWTVTVNDAAKELVMTFPFTSLTATQAQAMAVGASVAAPIASVFTNFGTPAASLTAPSIDLTKAGEDFEIGSDVPADVACTVDCP
jgi:hypothetical protein